MKLRDLQTFEKSVAQIKRIATEQVRYHREKAEVFKTVLEILAESGNRGVEKWTITIFCKT